MANPTNPRPAANCNRSSPVTLAGGRPPFPGAGALLVLRHACFVISLLLSACREEVPASSLPGTARHRLLVPERGAYAGAYIDFGEYEDAVTLEAIESFEKLVGKRQAIVASSSYWGEGTFPAKSVQIIWRHGAVPLVFWSPWDRPYEQDKGPDRFSLTSILAGDWDPYIDSWADAARDFQQPLMVSFANEMNGSWFPWSGTFYGGGESASTEAADPATVAASARYRGPETFKAAYRHIVQRVRARGASNILWVFHVVNYSYPQEPWNLAREYYPGSDYVDWLGLSVYGKQVASEGGWGPFLPLFDHPYAELSRIDPSKPIMLAEWGVGEFPEAGQKSDFIAEAFESMKKADRYPRLKAAVFWHERWQNKDGSFSNLRVNSSPESLQAYRAGVADPHFLGKPILLAP